MILGKRQSGKTYLAKHLCKDIPCEAMLAICPVATKSLEYKICDPAYEGAERHEEFKEGALANVWDKQVCILDDCIYDKESYKQEPLHYLMMKTPSDITLVHTQSFPVKVPAVMRSKMDYVFIFGRNSAMTNRQIYELYGHVFPSYEDFLSSLEHLTSQSYHCMVIYNNEKSSKIKDCVFWYVAPQST